MIHCSTRGRAHRPTLDKGYMLVARKATTRGPYSGHLDCAEPLVNPIR